MPTPITSASHPRCTRADAVGWPPQDQRRGAQEGEHHLRDRPDRDVSDHRGGRLARGNASRRQQAGPCEVAADLGGGQERVDRFADPAEPQHGQPGEPPAREQRLPGGRVQLDRDEPVQRRCQQRRKTTVPQDPDDIAGAGADRDGDQAAPPPHGAQGDEPGPRRHRGLVHQ